MKGRLWEQNSVTTPSQSQRVAPNTMTHYCACPQSVEYDNRGHTEQTR